MQDFLNELIQNFVSVEIEYLKQFGYYNYYNFKTKYKTYSVCISLPESDDIHQSGTIYIDNEWVYEYNQNKNMFFIEFIKLHTL